MLYLPLLKGIKEKPHPFSGRGLYCSGFPSATLQFVDYLHKVSVVELRVVGVGFTDDAFEVLKLGNNVLANLLRESGLDFTLVSVDLLGYLVGVPPKGVEGVDGSAWVGLDDFAFFLVVVACNDDLADSVYSVKVFVHVTISFLG